VNAEGDEHTTEEASEGRLKDGVLRIEDTAKSGCEGNDEKTCQDSDQALASDRELVE
jgi:hypothetical protein